MKFSMTVLFVNDINISKNFYQKLFNLKIKHDFSENIVFKDSLSIWQKNRAEEIIFDKQRENKNNKEKNVELYFETSNIEKISKKIKQEKYNIIHDLKEEIWGQKTIRLYDPDNYIIEIAEPMDSVILRFYKNGLKINEISKKTQFPINHIERIIQDNQ